MLRPTHITLLFVPAILIALFAFFIVIVQYEPLYPKQSESQQIEGEKFNIPIFPDDPISGDKKAPITLVTFEDLGCEGCRSQNELLNELNQKHPGKIKIIWKLLTVTKFPHSTESAHQYAYCLNKQNKFNEFKEIAFANNTNLSPTIVQNIGSTLELNKKKLTTCLSDNATVAYLENIKEIARSLNIQSVPRIFIDNQQIQAPGTIAGWEQLLELNP